MKKIVAIVLILSICPLFLISCGESKEQKIKELQKQVQAEQKAKEIAEKKADKTKSIFNLWVGIGFALVLIALIIGVAMGSKTRKDANNKSPERKANAKRE